MGKRHRWVGWTVGAIVAMSVVGALAIRFTPTHPFLDSIALLKNVRPKLVRESLSDLSQVGFKDPASSLPLVVSEEETFEIPRPFVEIDAELRSELRSAPSSTLTDSGLAMYSSERSRSTASTCKWSRTDRNRQRFTCTNFGEQLGWTERDCGSIGSSEGRRPTTLL